MEEDTLSSRSWAEERWVWFICLGMAKLRKRKRAILYSGAVGLIILIVVFTLILFSGRAEAINSIAVLPLENLTGDTGQEYFVDGATDELIGQMATIDSLSGADAEPGLSKCVS